MYKKYKKNTQYTKTDYYYYYFYYYNVLLLLGEYLQ